MRDRYLGNAKKTYGNSILVTPDDVVRLDHPDEFPTNRPRLYNKLATHCNIALNDLNYILHRLPSTYKHKALANYNFEAFIQYSLQSVVDIEKKDKRTKSKKENKETKPNSQEYLSAYSLAVVMLNHSLDLIIKSMPTELQYPLKREIYPFLLTINGIANFSNSLMKTKFPHLSIPINLSPEPINYNLM